MKVAGAYVEMSSVYDRHLVIVALRANSHSLTLQIEEKLPLYMVLLTGEFYGSDIVMTASAKSTASAESTAGAHGLRI